MGAAAVVAVVVPVTGSPATASLIALLAVVLAAVQGTRRYGWRVLLVFAVISYVVSTVWENLSVMTGFPFGNYTYTLMPQLFHVPVIIGVLYFGIGYASWMTTNVILDRADERLNLRTRAGRVNLVALPVLAGAVMTMFDVGLDSISATIRQAWIWEDGGGVFGVPFTNYLGWWFCTWSFFQIWTLILAVRQTRRAPGMTGLRQISHLQPVLVYLMFGVCAIVEFISFSGTATTTDATGEAWNTSAIVETLMVFNIFSVIPVALFAISKLAHGEVSRP